MESTGSPANLTVNIEDGFGINERDAFTSAGRTEYENDIFDYFKTMLALRKKHSALSKGELIHSPPENDVYIYFKTYNDEIILNIINASDKEVKVDVEKYSQIISERIELLDLYTSEKFNLKKNSTLTIPSKKAVMFLVK